MAEHATPDPYPWMDDFDRLLNEMRARYGAAVLDRLDKVIMAGEPETPSPQAIKGPEGVV